ncbi:MAG: TolB family protein, partial [Terriglobales bacterium]
PNGEYLLLPEIVFDEEQPAAQATVFSSHLFRVESETAIRQDLSLGRVEDASPAYSPDGEWIAFGRKYLDERWTPGRQLWLMRADGTEPRPLTDEPDFNHSSISWNPDSGSLVYMRMSSVDPNLPSEIWVTDLAGSAALLLAEGGYLPMWIP